MSARRRVSVVFVLTAAVACSGCFVGIGPSLGVTTGGQMTAGWEAMAEGLVDVGQTFPVTGTVASSPEPASSTDRTEAGANRVQSTRDWRGTTYLVFEPHLGGECFELEESETFCGGGVTMGVRWDTLGTHTKPGAMVGLWGGATGIVGGPLPLSLVSVALGMRTGGRDVEFYLTPKVSTGILPIGSSTANAL